MVTGAGGGLGRAICIRLAQRGAHLLVADQDIEAADETVRLLGRADARAIACDVSDADSVLALADTMTRVFGGTDLLVNNAGTALGGAMGDLPLSEWERILRVNLWGAIHGCHVFVPRLRSQGSGAILNVASVAGLLTAPMMCAYNVSKAGVIALSESLYAELAGTGVGMTVLCPTFLRPGVSSHLNGIEHSARSFAQRVMSHSHVTMDDAARVGLEAVDGGLLYAMPDSHERWLWRMKRAAPEAYYRMVASHVRKLVPVA